MLPLTPHPQNSQDERKYLMQRQRWNLSQDSQLTGLSSFDIDSWVVRSVAKG